MILIMALFGFDCYPAQEHIVISCYEDDVAINTMRVIEENEADYDHRDERWSQQYFMIIAIFMITTMIYDHGDESWPWQRVMIVAMIHVQMKDWWSQQWIIE